VNVLDAWTQYDAQSDMAVASAQALVDHDAKRQPLADKAKVDADAKAAALARLGALPEGVPFGPRNGRILEKIQGQVTFRDLKDPTGFDLPDPTPATTS
jgi:hypothetical protein